tara:strand:- start:415 stop:588 length:174 start_codon:yes stop_codon:yes gene_type:complete
MQLDTFRITFHLREPMRPRQTRIVRAHSKEEARAIFLRDSSVPATAITDFLNIKQIQ